MKARFLTLTIGCLMLVLGCAKTQKNLVPAPDVKPPAQDPVVKTPPPRAGLGRLGSVQLKSVETVEVVLFDFDSDRITPAAAIALDAIKTEGLAVMSIAGGTCPVGSADYNYALGMRRAQAVAAYLNVDCELLSYGERNQVSRDYALNRRAELTVR